MHLQAVRVLGLAGGPSDGRSYRRGDKPLPIPDLPSATIDAQLDQLLLLLWHDSLGHAGSWIQVIAVEYRDFQDFINLRGHYGEMLAKRNRLYGACRLVSCSPRTLIAPIAPEVAEREDLG